MVLLTNGQQMKMNTQQIDHHYCRQQQISYVVQSTLPQVHKHENRITNQNFTTDP